MKMTFVSVFAVTCAATACGTDQDGFRSRGSFASGTIDATSADGCTRTQLVVGGQRTEESGPPSPAVVAFASLHIDDACSGRLNFGASVEGTAEFDPLTSAQLRIELFLGTGETVTLDITITGTGDIVRDSRTETDYTVTSHRHAVVVGSLVVGGVDLLAGAEGSGGLTEIESTGSTVTGN